MAEESSGERGDGVTVPGDDTTLADERLAAARVDRHVRVRALAVEGEQVGHAERIAVILLMTVPPSTQKTPMSPLTMAS